MKKESIFQNRILLFVPFLLLAIAYAWKQASFPAYTGEPLGVHCAPLSNMDKPCFMGANYGAHFTRTNRRIPMACRKRIVCRVPGVVYIPNGKSCRESQSFAFGIRELRGRLLRPVECAATDRNGVQFYVVPMGCSRLCVSGFAACA